MSFPANQGYCATPMWSPPYFHQYVSTYPSPIQKRTTTSSLPLVYASYPSSVMYMQPPPPQPPPPHHPISYYSQKSYPSSPTCKPDQPSTPQRVQARSQKRSSAHFQAQQHVPHQGQQETSSSSLRDRSLKKKGRRKEDPRVPFSQKPKPPALVLARQVRLLSGSTEGKMASTI